MTRVSWDLGNGTITLRKTICENTLQKTLNSPTVVKVFQNKSGQAVEKCSDLISGLFGFIKATKFRDSSGISECVQNVWPHLSMSISNPKKIAECKKA